MPNNKPRYKVEQVIEALKKTKGMKGPAARMLGCSWTTVNNYAQKHPSIAAVIHEEREQMTDVAELALARAIQNGEAWAVCFYLKTQGRNRGYVERPGLEVSGPNGGPITTKQINDGPSSTVSEIKEVEGRIAELEREIAIDPR